MGNGNNRPHESLGYLVHRTSRLIRKYLNKELTRKGYRLTGEQYDVLVQLWYRDEQHQQELAGTLFKDKTTMTRLINSIEALDLVKRTSNRKDKRQKIVCLTASGKVLMKDLTGLAQTSLRKALKGIRPSDMAVCRNVLIQLNDTLSKELA